MWQTGLGHRKASGGGGAHEQAESVLLVTHVGLEQDERRDIGVNAPRDRLGEAAGVGGILGQEVDLRFSQQQTVMRGSRGNQRGNQREPKPITITITTWCVLAVFVAIRDRGKTNYDYDYD